MSEMNNMWFPQPLFSDSEQPLLVWKYQFNALHADRNPSTEEVYVDYC